MTKPATRKPAPSRSIFINCPFDKDFEPILRAMVFAIVVSGYHPRCALDSTDGSDVRLGKIAAMIGECDWGIHDLSRIEVDASGAPRFNMPMELGLHLGAKRFGEARQRRKRALILDAEPHRYDRVLSDISGQDIGCHSNNPDDAIRCVRNWLSEHRPRNRPPLPGAAALTHDYREFEAQIASIAATRRLDPDNLIHSDFLFAVRDWLTTQALR